jgi:hypothetical protein
MTPISTNLFWCGLGGVLGGGDFACVDETPASERFNGCPKVSQPLAPKVLVSRGGGYGGAGLGLYLGVVSVARGHWV